MRIPRTLRTDNDLSFAHYDSEAGLVTALTQDLPKHFRPLTLPYHSPCRFVKLRCNLGEVAKGQVTSFEKLHDCYNAYMSIRDWDFSNLEQILSANPHLLTEVIPKIAQLALELTHTFPKIPVLGTDSNSSLSLTKHQVSVLLANAFFCTFDEVWDKFGRSNTINMTRWFSLKTKNGYQKLLCIFAYFEKVIQGTEHGVITFVRQTLPSSFKFEYCDELLCDLHVEVSQKIEERPFADQAVFANARIGGGVMRSGCVQEEIRYLIAPECLISCLVCERLSPTESVLILGPENYSNYSGYGSTFEWKPLESRDTVKRDEYGHAPIKLIVMDAINYARKDNQFEFRFVERELRKAMAAFVIKTSPDCLEIASGNWGCGAFGGNPHLKFLIQLLAASAAGRKLSYHSFGNEKLASEIESIYGYLKSKNVTVSQLYTVLISGQSQNIFEFLTSHF